MITKPDKSPAELPHMTGWFGPSLLLKLLWRVIVSDLFGQYADRRLIVAALDPVKPEELVERARQFMPGGDNEELWTFTPDQDGALWIDWVADLGDGFDSTYAIASLLARDTLLVDDQTLPRGQLLVMGGDEVYPTASSEAYHDKLITPYGWAFPDPHPGLIKGPPVYAIPGNHDWYDGLVVFLALFSRKEHLHLGGWRTHQRRSYFALQLTQTWWIWGMDSQLDDDMDQPQKDYFVAIAKDMAPNSNIILCGPEPGWLYTRIAGNGSLKIMDYLANIAINHCSGVKIPLVISGDTHHYSRYEGDKNGTQFVTSGGGGAFLHPTHQLAHTINVDRDADGISWANGFEKTLKLATSKDKAGVSQEACYPTRSDSMAMLAGNFLFPLYNPGFGFVLGTAYWLLGLVAVHFPSDAWYVSLLVLAGGFYGYTRHQEGSSPKIGLVSLVNGVVHSVVALELAWTFAKLNLSLVDPGVSPRTAFIFFAAELILVGGMIAAEMFGIYLYLSSGFLGINHNDGFSSMRRDSHRNFVRMRITDAEIRLFPVGLTQIPDRAEWKLNASGSGPRYLPREELKPHLIEPPITIPIRRATPQTPPSPSVSSG
ncbi:hypothetical protein XH89_20075 [Bradyrhizobium sp. CCBAU 53340]|uniref:metallophosphoesterase n=1 Tax=Bradyrhizobium sp. CCBAU 53340 TaxID=1325112 RepID=UPI00188AD1D6|nr:metallophosphoesterase [Bradyrhizobium sp. CCBAU 53340]QOZ45525.1 hypothetical protein XH89_20075 [Bradyrhizobium sp. CCBAU 53340]